jgi:hypothetical protein
MRIKREQDELPHQLYLPDIDTHVLVENHEGAVVLRASSNHLSERRKAFFVRHLAAEGFIPIRYQWLVGGDVDCVPGLTWIVDNSWLRLHPAMIQRTNRIMRRILIGAGTLWVVMILALLARTH